MTQYLLLNADDFGMTARVNAAVLRAHREGVLTSASLMVAEEGWQEAVEIARHEPRLGVGLHVVATVDRSALPARDIPHIVNRQGRFLPDPLRAGLLYAFSKTARAELQREMEAQFARFAQTGLPWSHADSHQHIHMHPVVLNLFLDLCDRYGVHRIRVPRESLRAHLRAGGDRFTINTVPALVLNILARRAVRLLHARRTLGGKPIFFCDQVCGTFQSGNMHAAYVRRLLDSLPGTASEVYFHPGTAYARALPADRQTQEVRDVELHALLDPGVRAIIEARGFCIGRYEEIEAARDTMGEGVRPCGG
jgi:hopanoid biosynthesis associated protein HpnK